MIGKTETVEEWVKRVNQEPIWREVVVIIDRYKYASVEEKHFREELIKGLANTFSSDVFSLHWLEAPQQVVLNISSDIIRHANIAVLHARKEITRKAPPKEQLWRALRQLYEETKHQKELNNYLQGRISELEERLELK